MADLICCRYGRRRDNLASLVAGCEGSSSSVLAETTVGCCLYVEGFVLEAMTIKIVGGEPGGSQAHILDFSEHACEAYFLRSRPGGKAKKA